MYLALTGETIYLSDVMFLGLATHYIESKHLTELQQRYLNFIVINLIKKKNKKNTKDCQGIIFIARNSS